MTFTQVCLSSPIGSFNRSVIFHTLIKSCQKCSLRLILAEKSSFVHAIWWIYVPFNVVSFWKKTINILNFFLFWWIENYWLQKVNFILLISPLPKLWSLWNFKLKLIWYELTTTKKIIKLGAPIGANKSKTRVRTFFCMRTCLRLVHTHVWTDLKKKFVVVNL